MSNGNPDQQAERNVEVESRLSKQEARLEAILPTLASKADLNTMGERLSTDIAEMRVELHKIDASFKTWTLATMLSIVGTMLAALFGLNQINKQSAPLPAQPPVIINLPGSSQAPVQPPR